MAKKRLQSELTRIDQSIRQENDSRKKAKIVEDWKVRNPGVLPCRVKGFDAVDQM